MYKKKKVQQKEKLLVHNNISRGKVTMLLFVLLISSIWSNLSFGQISDLSNQIGQLTYWKSKAEQWAELIKHDPTKKNTDEYYKAWDLYIEAKSATDAWINEFSSALTISSEAENKKNIVDMENKSKEFVNYVRPMYVKGFSGKEIGEFAISIGMTIFKEYISANEHRKKEIKVELENVRWKSFNDI